MSHVLRVGVTDQIAYFRAYNTDGSAKTDLTSSTTGLSLSVFRVGASSVSISSLSNKAADNTAHADGAIRNVGGNLYTIDIPDAATATQVPSIVVRGSYTGGVIEGLEHPIVAYDPSLAYQQQLWAATTSTVNLSGTTIKTATDVEADTLDIQSRIPATLDGGNMRSSVQSMAANTLTASVLATDAVTEIQTGLATSTGVTAGFTEIKGTGWSSSTDTLEKISESSGGGNITVAPLQATAPNRVAGSQVVTYINDTSDIGPIAVSDSNGDAVDLSAYTLKVCVEQRDGTVLHNATPTVSGTGNNQIAWTPNAASVATTDYKRWSLRVVSTGQVLALGDFIVDPAAKIST